MVFWSLIEVKCPSSIKDLHPKEATKQKKIKFATLDEDGNLRLKEYHEFYYQIQRALHITNRNYCVFVIWSKEGILVEKVKILFYIRVHK